MAADLLGPLLEYNIANAFRITFTEQIDRQEKQIKQYIEDMWPSQNRKI